jgi:cofilin
MAMSGVTVDDSVVVAFDDLKKRKTCRYLILHIENTTTIKIAHTGARSESYDDFSAKFTPETPAYGVFDFEYDTPDGPREKLILVAWIPDTSKPKFRMLYTHTHTHTKRKRCA